MADGAILVAGRRQVMESRCVRMTFQAQGSDFAANQQEGVGAPMGLMAARASQDRRSQVFEHERPLLVRMALHAGQLFDVAKPAAHGRPMRLMAIAAPQNAIRSPMSEGHAKLPDLRRMAGEAQIRLGFMQEACRPGLSGPVTTAVAVVAGDSARNVNAVIESRGLQLCVAGQAAI